MPAEPPPGRPRAGGWTSRVPSGARRGAAVTAADPLGCARCGEVIGVYEPLVVRLRDGFRETSLAADPELPVAGADHFHLACWTPGPGAPSPGVAAAREAGAVGGSVGPVQ